jgi:hypothetical protein
LKLEGAVTAAAPIVLNNANQTLEIGPSADVSLAAETMTDGTIKMDGGRLGYDLSLSGPATIIGKGTLTGNLSGTGTVKARGGILYLRDTISKAPVLQIDTTPGSTLQIVGTTTSPGAIALNNANQKLIVGSLGNLTINAAENASNGNIKLGGGTLADSAGITLTGPAVLWGGGTVAANTTISGTGTIQATSGGFTLLGNLTGGLSLKSQGGAFVLGGADSVSSFAFISPGNLEVRTGASLAVGTSLAIGANSVSLDGSSSTLTDSSGVTMAGGTITGAGSLGANTNLSGYGTLSQLVTGPNILKASGGTLDVTGDITAANVTGLQIDNKSQSTLQLDGTVAAGDKITFLGTTGVLDLTHFSSPGTNSAVLTGFNATIAGLAISTSFGVPTANYIDLSQLSASNIASATLNTATDLVTVTNTASSSFILQLSGSYAPGTQVAWATDGGSGSKLFLAAPLASNNFKLVNTNSAASKSDSWSNSASWSSGTPAASPAANTALAFTETGNANIANDSTIVMPLGLRQATGSGMTMWTVADTGTTPFSSSLTLKNLGQVFVNATNNFTAATGSTSNNGTLTGVTAPNESLSTVGSQYFENDGSLNVIGTGGTGTSTASFSTGNTNLGITGTGFINVYGNAQVTFGANVGVGSNQTIKFITANGHTSGQVTEVSASQDSAQIAGLLPGDKLVLQNLGGIPTAETVADGNGFATVSISVGSDIVDSVTFLGNYTNGAADFTFSATAGNGGTLTVGAAAPPAAAAATAHARVGPSLQARRRPVLSLERSRHGRRNRPWLLSSASASCMAQLPEAAGRLRRRVDRRLVPISSCSAVPVPLHGLILARRLREFPGRRI